MSTLANETYEARVVAASEPGVTFSGALSSEWIKFRTLRSSWAVLLAAVVALVAIAGLIGYVTGSKWDGQLDPEDRVASAPLQGLFLAQLLIGVLGVLFVSGEYTTGMIRSTLAAVPRRLPVLWAKGVVYGLVTLSTLIPTTFLAYGVAQLFLSHFGHSTSLSAPTAFRAVLATGIYLALVGLLGSALGWIVRSTPGGISLLVGLLLIVPVLLEVVPGQWAKDISHYLPSAAGASFYSSLQADGALSPGAGLLVLVIWVAVATTVAAFLLKRRDG
ncbi:ABC transporter permease subunit [Kineosporia mesophila]|uniref:ABC transporter permease subunit n=1 Tax=Kineosporia mesophila TaxID=566012 RepID=A0ABP6ZPR1_9ACTN|nr:ABC transporter permease [Kineosporia mesophila]MCD5353673.1 ABC transporter permease [Kineosporia mesophila]